VTTFELTIIENQFFSQHQINLTDLYS